MMLNDCLHCKMHLCMSLDDYGYCAARCEPVQFCDDLVKILNQYNTSTARSTDTVSLYHYFEVLFPMQNLVNKWQQQCKKREILIF